VRRPVIGLCAAVERARWSVWDDEAVLLPRSYALAVSRAGGLPVLLPPPEGEVEAGEWLDLLDGLILAGGADYGEVPDRDAFEMALGLEAMERDLPLLGVCRGMQLMNLARGGTLIDHLPDVVGHEDHRLVPGAFGDHDVRLAEGSLAARVAGTLTHATKSHHHQGVDAIGDGLTITGWASIDDLPEALEDRSRRFALGVQWHPEADPAAVEIAALVEAARAA
jgi:putative glutamine amidotransferase